MYSIRGANRTGKHAFCKAAASYIGIDLLNVISVTIGAKPGNISCYTYAGPYIVVIYIYIYVISVCYM